MFKRASKEKYLYPTAKGLVNTEDLWDMSLTSLNDTAQRLDTKATTGVKKSFLKQGSTADTLSEAKLLIVVAIITEKEAAAEAHVNDKALKDKRQKLMALIADKGDEADGKKSMEQLVAELAAL